MSTNQDNKVAVVEAVRAKLDESSAAVVTEYRGLTVAEMAALRKAIRTVGGDFKVFKNTLVRRAVSGSDLEPMTELLEGPTAIAFVYGDVSAVAKALQDFAKASPALIIKGGVLDGSLLGARELGALANLPSREVLLSMFAGALAAPMRTMAGLLKALPQNLAYGLSALLESKGGAPAEALAPADEPAPEAVAPAPPEDAAAGAETAEVPEGAVDAEATADGAAADEAPAEAQTEASAEAEATADEAGAEATAEPAAEPAEAAAEPAEPADATAAPEEPAAAE